MKAFPVLLDCPLFHLYFFELSCCNITRAIGFKYRVPLRWAKCVYTVWKKRLIFLHVSCLQCSFWMYLPSQVRTKVQKCCYKYLMHSSLPFSKLSRIILRTALWCVVCLFVVFIVVFYLLRVSVLMGHLFHFEMWLCVHVLCNLCWTHMVVTLILWQCHADFSGWPSLTVTLSARVLVCMYAFA